MVTAGDSNSNNNKLLLISVLSGNAEHILNELEKNKIIKVGFMYSFSSILLEVNVELEKILQVFRSSNGGKSFDFLVVDITDAVKSGEYFFNRQNPANTRLDAISTVIERYSPSNISEEEVEQPSPFYIDLILEKINDQGMNSLSKNELLFLEKNS